MKSNRNTDEEHPDTGTVHWMHPRWHGEDPLFRVEPTDSMNEYYIAHKLGPSHVGVRGRWWYVETDDEEVEKRAEVIGYKTPVPEWVRDALLGYENDNYGPIEEVLNPVDDNYHDAAAAPETLTGTTDRAGSEDTLGDEEAEELLHEAGQNIHRVIVERQELTEELIDLLEFARKANAYAYFRIGREDESPSLAEIAESQDWEDELKEVLQP